MQSEKAKMLAGELYVADCPELAADNARASAWLDRFNARLSMPVKERYAMLCELFASVGEDAFIRPPFHCDYGYNISLGGGAFLNFGCVILDVVEVSIGDMTQIGPGVQLLAADHPRDPEQRRKRLEFGRPVRIGSNVWIGGGALVMPGVTVGDDAIIGSGAVVTRDVPRGATAVGNPARVLPRSAG
jgi:maltose O-acetyltransferase